jgi:hypothetical protein
LTKTPSTIARRRRTLEDIVAAANRRPGATIAELAHELGVEKTQLLTARDALNAAPAGSPTGADAALPQEIFGPVPSEPQIEAAGAAAEAVRREQLEAALDGALTRDEAAARLAVTAQAVSERRAAERLTALKRGREWRFPAWQFREDSVLDGLPEVIKRWPGTPLALTTWANRPHPDLDGLTPAQMLARRGGRERVLDLLTALATAG